MKTSVMGVEGNNDRNVARIGYGYGKGDKKRTVWSQDYRFESQKDAALEKGEEGSLLALRSRKG